jgi:putative inorganic carbon (hco3(-)) transporter
MQSVSKRLNSLQLLIFLVFGGALGLAISVLGRLPNTYLMVALAGISFPFIALMVGDMRKFLIVATAAVLPIRMDVNFYHLFENQAGAHTLGISLQDIFVIMLLLLWIVEAIIHKKGTFHGFKSLTIPAILYIEICILTLIWAPRIELSVMEIVKMIKVFILFFVLANQIRDKQDLKLVVWGLVLAVGSQGVLALMQTIKGGIIGLDFLGEAPIKGEVKANVWRVMGTLGHPNRLAMFLEILLPICFGFFLVEKKVFNRVIIILIFGLGIVALIMTGSRGAWISFFIAMVILFYFAVRNKQMKSSTLFGTALVGIILISSIALMFTEMIEQRLYGDDHGSAMSRIPMIQIAFNLIKAHPFGGVGINNYQVEMKKYNDTILGRRFRTIPRPVHNMYLLVMGETGIFGIAALMLLLMIFGKIAIKNVSSKDPLISVVNAAVFGGFIAMCIHGMVDKHPPGNYPLFFILMAIVASSSILINEENQKSIK